MTIACVAALMATPSWCWHRQPTIQNAICQSCSRTARCDLTLDRSSISGQTRSSPTLNRLHIFSCELFYYSYATSSYTLLSPSITFVTVPLWAEYVPENLPFHFQKIVSSTCSTVVCFRLQSDWSRGYRFVTDFSANRFFCPLHFNLY